MSFLKLLNPDYIQIGSHAVDKDSLIKEIARLAKNNPLLNDLREEDIFKALKAREQIGSTGFGNNIAIPHCSFDNLNSFVVGLIVIPEGIDFNSLDGKKTMIFFFIIGPKSERNKHIKILSSISKLIKHEKSIANIIKIDKKKDLIKYLFSIFEEKDMNQVQKEKCILNIFIQNEEYFDDILQLISSAVEGAISVIETNNAGYYMHRLPLFSGFWNDKNKMFMKNITAVVDKDITNDLIRKIHMLSKNMDLEPGILITAQDLFYSAGSIDF